MPDEPTQESEKQLDVAVVEIKTMVSGNSVGRGTQFACVDLLVLEMNSEQFQKVVPKEHAAQLVHHCVTLDVSWFFYICASEAQILYTVLSACPDDLQALTKGFYGSFVTPALSWAHSTPMRNQISTGDEELDRTITSRLGFWKTVDEEVTQRGPFIPVKIFKHASQTLYNKTKGGVDGNAQMRAILRCPTDTLNWEQKLVTQVFKSVAVNSWVAWRQLQREDLLRTKESFKTLDLYRNALNKIESLADFIFELTPELLSYADKLDKDEENSRDHRTSIKLGKVKKTEMKRLISKARTRKRCRLNFFNSSDGVALRLRVPGHDHCSGDVLYCALCSQNKMERKEGFRGHRTGIRCRQCNLPLCVKVRKGFRRSCWDVWHSIKTLKTRQPHSIETPNDHESDQEDEEEKPEEDGIQTRARTVASKEAGAS